MLTHYPTKRSVLVPTLLYAQDETGFLSDEVIAEIATRLELTELDVRNVISYYSMLTTKPRGKFNKGTTPDGMFSFEHVECIGACSWAPAAQVNYDFHENLTTEKMDKVLDEYRRMGR
jgi:NADH-quinone oxidoreductase subunit E